MLIIVVSVILALAIAAVSTFFILKNTGRRELFDDAKLDMLLPESVDADLKEKGDTIIYKGHTYQYNKDITTLLFLGVDKRTMEGLNEQGTGGQADVLVMIALDVKNRKLSMVALPRDTITEVATYTPGGTYNGMKDMQVCLAYTFGNGKETSCENTVAAVRRVFYNVPVKTYYALDLDGIAAINDSVGGVDVVSPETIGEFEEGKPYYLLGKSSERFVRDRNHNLIDSSLKRLDRQKIYANSFLNKMMTNIKEDLTSAVSIFNDSSPYSCTNLNAAKVTYLATEMATGGGLSQEMMTVPGKISYDNNLARYDIDEEKFFEMFLSVYYEKLS